MPGHGAKYLPITGYSGETLFEQRDLTQDDPEQRCLLHFALQQQARDRGEEQAELQKKQSLQTQSAVSETDGAVSEEATGTVSSKQVVGEQDSESAAAQEPSAEGRGPA